MYKLELKKDNKIKRKARVRKKVFGTHTKPRLSVFRSNKHIYGQIVNDEKGVTLVSVSDLVKEVRSKIKGKTKKEIAFEVGKVLAKKAGTKGITEVVFDKSCYRYHGRVKNLADGARGGGLAF